MCGLEKIGVNCHVICKQSLRVCSVELYQSSMLDLREREDQGRAWDSCRCFCRMTSCKLSFCICEAKVSDQSKGQVESLSSNNIQVPTNPFLLAVNIEWTKSTAFFVITNNTCVYRAVLRDEAQSAFHSF